MRKTTCFAGLLVLSASIFGCRQSPPPLSKPIEKPAAAPAPVKTHQGDTAAIDSSISANVGAPAKVREVITALQDAVRQHNAEAVAALVSYPITINPQKPDALIIRDPKSFIDHYNQIITSHIADIIENQKYEALFVNYQGAMLGNGEIWISGICRDKTCNQTDIKIRTIQNTSGKPK
jgi:hypothetical protein